MMEGFYDIDNFKNKGYFGYYKGVLRKRVRGKRKRGIATGVFPLFYAYV